MAPKETCCIYWITQFNMLRESIKIDKWSIGNKVEYMDLKIYKGSRFFTCGKMNVKLHQKKENKWLYLPHRSGHASHTIRNYVIGELKRYVRSNTKEFNFLGIKVKFYERLLDRGFIKCKLTRMFNNVKFSDRTDLLLSKNSCDIPIFQMTPEHSLERDLISEWDTSPK